MKSWRFLDQNSSEFDSEWQILRFLITHSNHIVATLSFWKDSMDAEEEIAFPIVPWTGDTSLMHGYRIGNCTSYRFFCFDMTDMSTGHDQATPRLFPSRCHFQPLNGFPRWSIRKCHPALVLFVETLSGSTIQNTVETNRPRDATAFSDFLIPKLYFMNHLDLSRSLLQSGLPVMHLFCYFDGISFSLCLNDFLRLSTSSFHNGLPLRQTAVRFGVRWRSTRITAVLFGENVAISVSSRFVIFLSSIVTGRPFNTRNISYGDDTEKYKPKLTLGVRTEWTFGIGNLIGRFCLVVYALPVTATIVGPKTTVYLSVFVSQRPPCPNCRDTFVADRE